MFDDPLLTELVHRSYAGNLNRPGGGVFQILQAQEQRAIAVGVLLPSVAKAAAALSLLCGQSSSNGSATGVGGTAGATLAPGAVLSAVPLTPASPVAGVTASPGATTTTNSSNPAVGATTGGTSREAPRASRFFSNVSTSLNLSWELDFWGLFRRNLESANASLDQSVANRDEIAVLLLANVATEYVQIRTLQKLHLDLARGSGTSRYLAGASRSDLQTSSFDNGNVNSYPGYYQLKSNLDNTKGTDSRARNRPAASQQSALHPVGHPGPRPAYTELPCRRRRGADPVNPGQRIVRAFPSRTTIPSWSAFRAICFAPGRM